MMLAESLKGSALLVIRRMAGKTCPDIGYSVGRVHTVHAPQGVHALYP